MCPKPMNLVVQLFKKNKKRKKSTRIRILSIKFRFAMECATCVMQDDVTISYLY